MGEDTARSGYSSFFAHDTAGSARYAEPDDSQDPRGGGGVFQERKNALVWVGTWVVHGDYVGSFDLGCQ
jgi:hypothetical protein